MRIPNPFEQTWLTVDAEANPSADEICYWDGPASELGLDTGRTPEPEPAAAAADETSAEAGDDSSDDETPARASADADADADDVDEDADPLDLLTTRDEQDEQTQSRPIEDRYKALSKRARKLEKSLKKSLPIQQALREAGVDLRTLLSSHQRLAAFEASLQANPRLRALLEGSNSDDPPADTRRAAAREEPVEYPFDVNDPVGRFMQEFHQGSTKAQNEILDRLERIEKSFDTRVGRIESTTVAQQRATTMNTWKTTATAAAEKLEPGVRQIFLDAVLSAAEGSLSGRHKLSVQQVIDHYLKPLKVSDKQKERASAAAKQKTAERNNNLPRRPAPGSGSPASPAARRVPRLEEFNRNLSRQFAR
jgi:hypothetical protein